VRFCNVKKRLNEEIKNINDVNNSEIEAQIVYKQTNQIRLNNLKQIKNRLKKIIYINI
jgi:hypothetical protein